MYTVLLTLYTVHCTLCTIKIYIVHCKQYTVHCTMYTVHCIIYTVHFTQGPECQVWITGLNGWLQKYISCICNNSLHHHNASLFEKQEGSDCAFKQMVLGPNLGHSPLELYCILILFAETKEQYFNLLSRYWAPKDWWERHSWKDTLLLLWLLLT